MDVDSHEGDDSDEGDIEAEIENSTDDSSSDSSSADEIEQANSQGDVIQANGIVYSLNPISAARRIRNVLTQVPRTLVRPTNEVEAFFLFMSLEILLEIERFTNRKVRDVRRQYGRVPPNILSYLLCKDYAEAKIRNNKYLSKDTLTCTKFSGYNITRNENNLNADRQGRANMP